MKNNCNTDDYIPQGVTGNVIHLPVLVQGASMLHASDTSQHILADWDVEYGYHRV